MSPLLTTVMGVVAVTALALDYMRERRLEEATVCRLDGELSQVRHDLHEQTRRLDAVFVAIKRIENLNVTGAIDDETVEKIRIGLDKGDDSG